MKTTVPSFLTAAILFVGIGFISSCQKEVIGCTYPDALNYNSRATTNDGSCISRIYGCTDNTAANYNPLANTTNGTCQYNGSAMFYYNAAGNDATVTVNGLVGYITSYYTGQSPPCGSSGCANFTLSPGTYSYHVETTQSLWDGTITVTANGCARILLI